MDERTQRTMARKMAVNTSVALVGISTASMSSLISDGALAFTVSTVSIHVAALAAMATVTWPFYLGYRNQALGDGDYEVYSWRDLLTRAGAWFVDATAWV